MNATTQPHNAERQAADRTIDQADTQAANQSVNPEAVQAAALSASLSASPSAHLSAHPSAHPSARPSAHLSAKGQQAVGQRIAAIGDHALLGSTALVLAWIGAMKFTAYEAGAIEGLVASSPLTAWLYSVFSLQGASNLIGSIEIVTALVLVLGVLYRPAAIIGALAAIVTFSVTLSFLFTAPGWEASLGGFPALSVVPGQFLLKDAVLLGAAIALLGKALNRRA